MLAGHVEQIETEKGQICREILTDLPEWFGIPEALEAYVRDAETLPMLGYRLDGAVVGFVSVKPHTPHAAEVHVLGVKRAWHRNGIGRALFAHLEQTLQQGGYLHLTVKTVAQTAPGEAYAATRSFYESIGFVALELFPDLWGPRNPCQLMVKRIGRDRPRDGSLAAGG
jgi:ribosomal protein S18 acetylase RimI-like enzyme